VTRVVDPTSVTAVTNALAGFRAIDEIAIVAVPGALDSAIQGAVIAHCENAGDRFGILDGQLNPASLTPALIKGSTGNSNYAAMYFPRIQVFDPVSNGSLYVAPSGHMAGIYARVDTQRGVHKAPANEVVLGAVGLEARLGKADQDGLNPAGINVIRNLNGNITVWGARTLGGDANNEWKYINVRRLFLFLRDSIDAGTQWVVFEPNDLSLWAKITRNVTAFLTNVWRSGALFGATPQEAFYVRCDATTNPPEVRDLGQVVTEIGVAVVRPAEFVVFRISQWAGPGK
jgi:phage tail sheath protein FI